MGCELGLVLHSARGMPQYTTATETAPVWRCEEGERARFGHGLWCTT